MFISTRWICKVKINWNYEQICLLCTLRPSLTPMWYKAAWIKKSANDLSLWKFNLWLSYTKEIKHEKKTCIHESSQTCVSHWLCSWLGVFFWQVYRKMVTCCSAMKAHIQVVAVVRSIQIKDSKKWYCCIAIIVMIRNLYRFFLSRPGL